MKPTNDARRIPAHRNNSVSRAVNAGLSLLWIHRQILHQLSSCVHTAFSRGYNMETGSYLRILTLFLIIVYSFQLNFFRVALKNDCRFFVAKKSESDVVVFESEALLENV